MTSPVSEPPKLSTYAKGELFEQKVFEYLTRELKAGRLFFSPQFSTIHRKHKYFSRDRDDYIVFDIAIEARLPGLENPSMIMLIECKHYEGSIPINDVEEFSAKIGQVTGHNAKGMFVSASAFQSSAMNFARNKGMAVVRWLDEDNFKWELARPLLMGVANASARRSHAIRHALIEPLYQPTVSSTYAATPLGYTNTWEGVFQGLFFEDSSKTAQTAELKKLLLNTPTTRERAAFLSMIQIEDRVQEVLRDVGYTEGSVDLGKLVDHERSCGGLEVTFSGASKSALGGISFTPPRIQIFADDKDAPMARFTLAHELGHFYLGHDKYMRREQVSASDLESHHSVRMPRGDLERLEWQANAFASFLLMPTRAFLERLKLLALTYEIRNRGHGFLYLDNQGVNYRNYRLVTDNLSKHFNVSKTAVRLRLLSLGLLVDDSSYSKRARAFSEIVSHRRWC
ncbi:ImmA/IrrE family metallo-endopeptidase [Pseudomonas shirazica]|uniref:ImmA/IrrE family metallo-endopeptidase n=1 Tax=Pseudomonas shirazica TaxID=1940636 RepID=A0ABY9SV10_9PSED|nr:ImmA/IrrE family metallo-endopeptidase [Pseudomonas shirazica]WMY87444.1 ImmA/IrrE family metallo-endopeptidase [Pseudomonas shirazica]